jgi:DNA-directed RNA polymerase subunit RPC12/RpoP
LSNEENETEETEKSDKTITIKHEFARKGKKGESPLIAELREKLQERTDQLSLIALKEFEGDKQKLLELVPEDRKEELEEFVDSPQKLETLRKIYSAEEEETSTRAPAGKATLPVKMGSETPSFDVEKGYSDPWIQKISDLYNVIGSPKSSAEDKQKAERVLDNLYLEMRKGLKERKNQAQLDYIYPRKARYGWNCQGCGRTNQTNSRPETGIACVHCGYKFGIDPVPTHPY